MADFDVLNRGGTVVDGSRSPRLRLPMGVGIQNGESLTKIGQTQPQ
jgi:hypothetical protein